MFKTRFALPIAFRLLNAEPGQEGSGSVAQNNPPASVSPAAGAPAAGTVDVQAQVNAALAQQQADFAKQLKEATGHSDLKALTEANLKAQGKLQELADTRDAEAKKWQAKFEKLVVNYELLSAATEAIDPATVKELLASRAKVDSNDQVTIDGKPVADAVKQLLDERPFLAKAQGDTGSGTPPNGGPAIKNPWSKEHWNLTEQVNLSKENPALAAQFKAAAGH
jgi:hypothetical protein